MSWDKNTINTSSLDAIRENLDELNIPCQLSVIAAFKGRGLNDDPYMDGTDRIYELRRLQYTDKVILEYMEQDADCDTDDVIYSEKFNLKDEPKDWEAIRHTDYTGEYSED